MAAGGAVFRPLHGEVVAYRPGDRRLFGPLARLHSESRELTAVVVDPQCQPGHASRGWQESRMAEADQSDHYFLGKHEDRKSVV